MAFHIDEYAATAKCKQCAKIFTTPKALYRHRRETKAHQGSAKTARLRFRCGLCDETFSRNYDLHRHMQRKHRKGKINPAKSQRHSKQYLGHQGRSSTAIRRNGKPTIAATIQLANRSCGGRCFELAGSRDGFRGQVCDAPIGNNFVLHETQNEVRLDRRINAKPILCTICHYPFALDDAERLFTHLSDHFHDLQNAHTCLDCQIGFVHEADLKQHRKSAMDGHCGFQFKHTVSCNGHHPPSEDHHSLINRLRNWEQCQLHAYMDAVDAVQQRNRGILVKAVRTADSNACRGCRILKFLQQQYPEELEYWTQIHDSTSPHRDITPGTGCCDKAFNDFAAKQLISKLTLRSTRAASADIPCTTRHAVAGSQLGDAIRPEEFLAPEANINVSYLADDLQNLLHYFACTGDTSAILQCFLHGAELDGRDMNGCTALHYAGISGSTEAAALLLDSGASLDVRDNDGNTPLLTAAKSQARFSGAGEVVIQYVRAGSNIDARNVSGECCLHLAAQSGNLEMVELLLSTNVEINPVNDLGQTPLLLAAREGHLPVVECLCLSKAELDIANLAGYTALSSAIDRKLFEIGEFLLNRGAFVADWVPPRAERRGAGASFVDRLQSSVVLGDDLEA